MGIPFLSFTERRVTDMKDIMDEDKRLEEELKELRQVPIDENDRKKKKSRRSRKKTAKRRGFPFAAVFMALVLGVLAGLGGGYYVWGWERPYTVDLKAVEVPDWVKQEFIRKNIFSRPDVSRRKINNIVLHYVANPGSSAEGHFIVGLEGEVIQCIPINEIAYANAPRNEDTLSIEVCHPDDTGKYSDATYESVVRLTAWLCTQLKLKSSDVVRHYDINGKLCPKYYVEHEEEWKQLRKDIDAAMKEL